MSERFTNLRTVLYLDAVTCAVMGVILVLGGRALSVHLGLSDALLRGAGLVLLPFAALLASTARATPPPPWLVWGIVAGNLAWGTASFALLGGGLVSPTALGTVVVLGQGIAVVALAGLELQGLRKAGAAA